MRHAWAFARKGDGMRLMMSSINRWARDPAPASLVLDWAAPLMKNTPPTSRNTINIWRAAICAFFDFAQDAYRECPVSCLEFKLHVDAATLHS